MVRILLQTKGYEYVCVRYLSTFAQCGLDDLPNVIVDVDDLPAEAFTTAVAGRERHLGEWFYNRLKFAGLRRRTAQLASRCRHVWVPNPEHVQLFSNASCLPNIPFPFLAPARGDTGPDGTASKVVLFVGLMAYGPNQDAARSFVAGVWPTIRREVPSARFEVVGGGCPHGLRRELEASEGVRVVGYREDLVQAYRECSVVVAPLGSGSGTSIKVLEAMYSRAAVRGVPLR